MDNFQFHIFSDNLVLAGELAKELEIHKFPYSLAFYKGDGEELIKFTIQADPFNFLEDTEILESLRLKYGL